MENLAIRSAGTAGGSLRKRSFMTKFKGTSLVDWFEHTAGLDETD